MKKSTKIQTKRIKEIADLKARLKKLNKIAADCKKAEDATKESQTIFRELFNHIESGVAVYEAVNGGKDFVFKDFNPAAEKIEKTDKRKVIGRCVTQVFPGVKEMMLLEVFRRVWETGRPEYLTNTIYTGKSGRKSWRENWVYRLPNGEIVAVYNDITERVRAEEFVARAYKQLKDAQTELIQSEKMAALGRFSAGIAHEIKNPLSIVLGGLEFLGAKLPRGEEDIEKAFAITKDSLLRANSILESLLQYSRPSDSRREVINIPDITVFVLDMVKIRARMSSVKIDTEFEQNMPVSVDKNQIQQVLLNILKNSLEAMPKGGNINIKTYKTVEPKLSDEKQSCVIEIKDNGVGISRKDLSKLSEPFFTTKERGVGTGLGLFISKIIVDNHGGRLLIDSTEGEGTTIKIVLPLACDKIRSKP